MAAQAKGILRTFLRRLTNLSGNNRSLLLLRLVSDQFADVQRFSFLNGAPAFEMLRALVKGSDYRICAIHDSRLEANNIVSTKLKMLQRADHSVFEERGTRDLHVGWPFLRGKFADGTLVRCPLLFFPVRLVQKDQSWILECREDAGITFNKTFLLAYAFYHNLSVDEDLLDFSFDEFDSEITQFRTQLYELLKNRIELNFNPDNFTDELQEFTEFRKSEFESSYGAGQLKLFPEAVLGLFPQAGSQLVPDYLHLLEDETFQDLEDFFTRARLANPEMTKDEYLVPVNHNLKEEKLYTPFPLDAWQENAIQEIKKGKSLVVQGPPGTGKSQLICNLLSDAMASGKKVLLVCQKRAALDVVYERMNKRGLEPFVALVHDFRNDRKEIFGKIARQIDRIDEYKTRNRSVDIIQMERRFVQVCRAIDQTTEELQEFKDALYNEIECGVSVKQLYLQSDPAAPSINLKQEYHHFMLPADSFLKRLRRYAMYAAVYEQPEHPWRERKSFAGLQASDQARIEQTIDDIQEFQRQLSEKVTELTGAKLGLEDCESLWYRHEEIIGMLTLIREDDVYRYFQLMNNEHDDETSMLWLSNMERVVLNCFDEIGPEVTIPTERLGKFQEALHERMRTRKNLIHKIRWDLFSENKFVIKRVLVANDLAYNRYGLRVLEQRIDTRLNLEHQITALRSRSWLVDLPTDYKKESWQNWFTKQKQAVRAKLTFRSFREIRESVNPETYARTEFHKVMRQLLDILKEIPPRKEEWAKLLSAYHIRKISSDKEFAARLRQSLNDDFDSLCEFDGLRADMAGIEENVVLKLQEFTGTWDPGELEKLFNNSINLAWIDHIELKHPVLRAVSSMKMEELQQTLPDLVSEKQKLSLDILLLRARENAYEKITYNRLNNMVSYRDLLHQVSKKKKLWPLRKLIATYHEELFQLVPCWMASPESVSAIFPMTSLFDLVIFDEASQCFSERGLPAMYRAKQVLVAGDGQQLRPNDLYQVRWSGKDDEEEADVEVESLLELAERYLPTVHLQGHYRSKSVELIEFSNRHFYGNRLRLLPDRDKLNRNEPALVYHRVDGVWDNGTNEAEAEEVTRITAELIAEDPSKEIGIVTFNAPQQNLIMDLVEERFREKGIAIPESLFIKNIENVQGDEKDIIIFSIGYAADKRGKVSLQFGSLNVPGGENRLNVAVTRAREKVIVVTSIQPEQLKTENTKNAGPSMLKSYLEFVRSVHERNWRLESRSNGHGGATLGTKLLAWCDERLNGFDFELQTLPHTDINIRKSDKYLAAILTDDERFQRSISIKDTFAYTPLLLKEKNWNYRYVYSRQLWKNRENLEQALMVYVGNQA